MGRPLTGSLEHKDGMWVAGVPVRKGDRRRLTCSFLTKQSAQTWTAEQVDRLNAGLDAEPAPKEARLRRQITAISCSGGSNDHLNGRLGVDGKRYGTAPPGWRTHVEALVRVDPTATVRTLAERTGASIGAVQTRRREVLDQLDSEHRVLRWWRRLRSRWTLRRVDHSFAVTR